jgi:hypothetical protein
MEAAKAQKLGCNATGKKKERKKKKKRKRNEVERNGRHLRTPYTAFSFLNVYF